MTVSSAIRTAYSTSQYDDNYPAGIENHWWTRARAEILLAAMAPFKNMKVLDVGCGRGLTVDFLRQKGFDCFGCELATPTIDDRLKPYVTTGIAAAQLEPGIRGEIDVLMLLDVVEHIAEPETFLDDLRSAFPKAAHLVVTVPARSELWTVWDDYYGHYRRYDRQSLQRLLLGAKLQPQSIRYIFRSLYPILFLAAKMATRSKQVTAPRRLLVVHRLIAWYFSAEAKFFRRSPFWGTSLLAIASTDHSTGA